MRLRCMESDRRSLNRVAMAAVDGGAPDIDGQNLKCAPRPAAVGRNAGGETVWYPGLVLLVLL